MLSALGILLVAIVGIIVAFVVLPMLSGTAPGSENNQVTENNTNQTQQPIYDCTQDLYDCTDFETQAQSQDVFDFCLQQGMGDIHGLDRGGNGISCEVLP